MANEPKKKTESAADAAPSSGAQSAPASATPAASTPGDRVADLEARIERLHAELDDRNAFLEKAVTLLGESIGAGVAKALREEREGQHAVKKAPKREVPPEFKGPRTYIVGPKGAYQGIRRFQQGERITVVDQFPAADWTPIEKADSAPTPQAAPAKQGRAADQHVG